MKQQSSENVGSNTTDPEVNQQRSEIYKHRRGETLTTVCLFRGSPWLQDFTTTCSETARAHFGPTPQRVHLGRSSAQLVAVNLVMENQTSVDGLSLHDGKATRDIQSLPGVSPLHTWPVIK